jgi:hypothetical protein
MRPVLYTALAPNRFKDELSWRLGDEVDQAAL